MYKNCSEWALPRYQDIPTKWKAIQKAFFSSPHFKDEETEAKRRLMEKQNLKLNLSFEHQNSKKKISLLEFC